MKDTHEIRLNLLGSISKVNLPYDETYGQLRHALYLLKERNFEAESPSSGRKYKFTLDDIVNILEYRNPDIDGIPYFIFAVNDVGQGLGLNYIPGDEDNINLYLPTDEELYEYMDYTKKQRPCILANKSHEYCTACEYRRLPLLVSKKGYNFWDLKLEEAYNLLTEEERKSITAKPEFKPLDYYIEKYFDSKK